MNVTTALLCVMEDFDSAGSSDYSLLGRIYRSKSLPDGDFSQLDDEGHEERFVFGHQEHDWDQQVIALKRRGQLDVQ